MEYFRDEIRKIMLCVNVLDGIYTVGAKKIGIKYNTLALFYALDDGKPHSQKEICEHWLIPKTTLNTIVKECMVSGYMVLDTVYQTKEKQIRLTDKGKEFANTILKQFYEVERRAMMKTVAAFSPEFVLAVKKFTEFLQEEIKKLPMENE